MFLLYHKMFIDSPWRYKGTMLNTPFVELREAQRMRDWCRHHHYRNVEIVRYKTKEEADEALKLQGN